MTTEPTKNPRPQQPNTDPGLLEPYNPQTSLVESLGGVVDSVRQISVDLGLHPYKVHAVRIKWTGGEIGRGEPKVQFDEPILPTPRVSNISNLDRESTAAGVCEKGTVRLDRISPRYTEDQIKYYFSTESDLGNDEEGFIEISIDERDGKTERKRYVVSGVPERRPQRFDWTVVLTKQEDDRLRNANYREERDVVWR
jgi:hypothetical protein